MADVKEMNLDELVKELVKEKTSYRTEPEHDFKLPGELTVTITLAEYRSLIKARGDYRESLADKDKTIADRDKTIAAMKSESQILKNQLSRLLSESAKREEAKEG